jgi:hypothetical protein
VNPVLLTLDGAVVDDAAAVAVADAHEMWFEVSSAPNANLIQYHVVLSIQ